MNALELVINNNHLVGEKIKTERYGDWEGGDCIILKIFPDLRCLEIVMQVKRISDDEEIGVFHYENVVFLDNIIHYKSKG